MSSSNQGNDLNNVYRSLRDLTSLNIYLTNEKTFIKKQLSEYIIENDRLKTDFENIKNENIILKDTIKSNETEINELRKENRIYKDAEEERKKNEQSKIDELTKSLNEFKESLPSNNKDSTDETNKSSQLTKQIGELTAAIKIQVEKIGPLTRENESLSKIVTDKNIEIEKLVNQNEALDKQLGEKNIVLNSKNIQNDILVSTNSNLLEQNSKLLTENQNKEIQIFQLVNQSLFSKINFLNNFISFSNNKFKTNFPIIDQKNIKIMFDSKKNRIEFMQNISNLYCLILYDEIYETKESILYDFCEETYNEEQFIDAIYFVTLSFTTKLKSY